MYVERGTKELVCAKKEMRLCEEEEREFDESLSLCLRLREGESFFFLIGFWLWGRKGFYFYSYFQIIDVKNYESLKSYMASSQEVKKKKVKGFGFIVYIN